MAVVRQDVADASGGRTVGRPELESGRRSDRVDRGEDAATPDRLEHRAGVSTALPFSASFTCTLSENVRNAAS